MLDVSIVPAPPTGPSVKIHQLDFDKDKTGRTSVRFFTNEARGIKPRRFPTDPLPGQYYERDRDLGQTFISHAQPFRLEALTLRTGPADNAIGAAAPGAAVSLQIFTVSGEPSINKNGTAARKEDDFITGEIYTSLRVISGGTLPQDLKKDQHLRWEVTGDDAILLDPGKKYAFLVMFDEPAPGRELALANNFFGKYPDGHGIRREGSIDKPFDNLNKVFNAKHLDDTDDRSASSLPVDRAIRLNQQPGTWGRPDVDTYRDLFFAITGVGTPDASAGGVEQAIAAIEKAGGRITRDENSPGKPVVSVIFPDQTVDDAVFTSLEVLTSLRELVLNSFKFTDAGISQLKGLKKLQKLDLSDTRITDAGLADLKGLTKLQKLDLSETEITNAGLAHLKGLTKLQKLDLSGTGITNAGLANLEVLPELRELNLSGTQFGFSTAEVHLNKFTKLQDLDLSGSGVKVANLKFGNALTKLQKLNLADAQITDDSLANLEGLTGLRDLNLGVDSPGLVTDAGLKHLKKLTNLQELNIVNQNVTETGVQELQQALPHTQILGNQS